MQFASSSNSPSSQKPSSSSKNSCSIQNCIIKTVSFFIFLLVHNEEKLEWRTKNDYFIIVAETKLKRDCQLIWIMQSIFI